MAKQWDKTHHEQAFDAWCETHNWSKVASAVGCAYDTPRRWAEDDFECADGCAFHGWERLERQKNAAIQSQVSLIEQGNFDPVEHNRAIQRVMMGGPNTPNRAELIKRTIRSDLERAAHWELIWSKAFYIATGQVAHWSEFHTTPDFTPRS